MDHNEIMAEAKRKYPEGTVHSGYNGGSEYTVQEPLYWDGETIYCNRRMGAIYHHGTWARIVSPKQLPIFN